MMRIGSLFSGVGGLERGLELAGLGTVAFQCEIDPFCRQVLAKHWPNATRYNDVREVGHGTARVDVLCGGFPCQDVSLAGKRAGLSGERSGLWYEYLRVIRELAPSIVVIENVLGLRTRGLRDVLAGVADLGFDAEWCDLSAEEVGAPHRRRRLFIVAAHPERIVVRGEPGWLGRSCWARAAELANHGDAGTSAHADSEGEPQPQRRLANQWRRASDGGWRPPVSPIRGVDAGVSDRMDGGLGSRMPTEKHGRRLKALGNAVVPQCAELVGRAILEATR